MREDCPKKRVDRLLRRLRLPPEKRPPLGSDVKALFLGNPENTSPPEVFLNVIPVKMMALRCAGYLLSFGRVAVMHSQLYWRAEDERTGEWSCWMTEMTSEPPSQGGEIVGRGDGYTIQITRVGDVEGQPVRCDTDLLEYHARRYANSKDGILPRLSCGWHAEPQGHGGPPYDKCNCNTYISWLLDKCIIGDKPQKPMGAWGWDAKPGFPGAKSNS